ncbi:hypothetical protein [Brevundimonas sp. FT23028]|uniref:hypothetical protein n=1 Tax=Brevundimonas sp. FT23028 TaxID=3393748 RepID=UPI003B587254
MRSAALIVSVLLVSACASGPRQLPLPPYVAPPAQKVAGRFEVVDEGALTPRRSSTVISADVSELYAPRFTEAVSQALRVHLSSRLTGQGDIKVRAVVQSGDVTVERGGVDYLPLVGGVASTVRGRTFVASGVILFEVEQNGRVERSYILRHSTRFVGTLTTDSQRAAATAGAIEQWRREAFAKADAEFLGRYL